MNDPTQCTQNNLSRNELLERLGNIAVILTQRQLRLGLRKFKLGHDELDVSLVDGDLFERALTAK